MHTDTYWAAESEQRKLIARALDRVAWGLVALKDSGRLELMRKMMSAYYGDGTDGTRDAARLQGAGEQGEVTEMHVNKIRPICQNVLSIVSAVRPAIKPVAVNGDASSAAETRLAMALHEFYARKLDAGSQEEEAMRGALICSSFSLVQRWAPSAGAEVAYDIEDDRLTFEGDIEAFLLPPWRIFYEPTSGCEPRWCVFRRREPRHDLIARARDERIKDKICSGATAQQSEHLFSRLVGGTIGGMTTRLEYLMGEDYRPEDEVWVWEVRHLPTPALPMGRLVRFIEPDIILFDSLAAGEPAPQEPGTDESSAPIAQATRFPYEELHAYEINPERIVGTRQGHSLLFDLMGLQDFHDMATASIATTVNLMGMPHLWSPLGAAPQVHQLSTGPTVIETPTKPEVIDLPALKPEVVQAAEWASSLMNQSAALNDTVMGSPQKGMPASAQALQRAQAVQFHNAVQGEWIRLIGKNANGRLRILKRFARTERVAELAGSGGAWELRQWSRDDIAGVPRFEVEPINAMSATFEGRQSLAEMMGVTGDALFDFITTGSLRKVTETQTLQLELVERNKALLLQGIGLAPIDMQASMQAGVIVFVDDGQEHVSILKSDPHHLAIPAYLSVINSPEARADAALTQAALDCVDESQRLWGSLTLDDCAAYGVPPLPSHSMQPPAMPGAAPMGSQEGGAVPTSEGAAIDLPAPPVPPPDPLTGEDQSQAELALPKDSVS